MASFIPHPGLRKRLIAAAATGLVIGFAFVAFFTSALHDPQPDAMRVGVVGPVATAMKISQQLNQAVPGAFDVRRYDDSAAAREALDTQAIDGAFIPDRTHPRLLVAGADGASTVTVLQAAFGAAAAASGTRLTVHDVAPVPSHDARGISAFFLVAGTTIGSVVFGIVLFFAGGHAITTPLRLRLALIAGFAALAGLALTAATDLVTAGVTGAYWGVAGITALIAAVVALTITALVRWLGTPGIALGAMFLMLFSLPATGGAVSPEFVPSFYRSVAAVLPSHAGLMAIRGTVYFHDGGTTIPILILLAWAAAALIVQIAAHMLRPIPPRPPATGWPVAAVGT